MSGTLDPRLIEPPYPVQALVGMRMTGWSDGYARFELPLAPKLMNRYGIPHGGIYALLLDTVMGYAGCWTGDPEHRRLAMTLSLTTNFLGRPAGTHLVGEGRRVGGGRRTYFAEGTVADEMGTRIAGATGTFRYRSGA